MFGLTISPKLIITLVICLLLGGGVWYGWSTYTTLQSELKSAQDEAAGYLKERNDLVATNRSLNNELISALKDASDKELINKDIAQKQEKVDTVVAGLSTELAREVAKRKEAETKSGSPLCIDPRPKPPEVDITWRAYCAATHDPTCATRSTKP